MRDAVVTRDLVVRYEDFTALSHVTLRVHYGEALGILGPNGSGKSTLLKTIAGLLSPSGGELACSARRRAACHRARSPTFRKSKPWIGRFRLPYGM